MGGVMAVGVPEAVPVDAGAEVIARVLTGVSAAKLGALVVVDVPPEAPTAVGALAVVVAAMGTEVVVSEAVGGAVDLVAVLAVVGVLSVVLRAGGRVAPGDVVTVLVVAEVLKKGLVVLDADGGVVVLLELLAAAGALVALGTGPLFVVLTGVSVVLEVLAVAGVLIGGLAGAGALVVVSAAAVVRVMLEVAAAAVATKAVGDVGFKVGAVDDLGVLRG